MKYIRRRPRAGPRGSWRIVILIRRIDIAVVVSILAHLLLLALLPGPPPSVPASAAAPPMQVVIVSPQVPVAPEPTPQETIPRPAERVATRPPTVSRPRPSAQPTPQPDAAPTEAPPRELPQPPAVDMMAAIEARRASRRAAEAGRNAPPAPQASDDAASRNLKTLTGGEGVGGVFEILEKGTRRGTFAFNGWKPETRRAGWRTVIEVDAGLGGDIEIAMVRRMIQLIREYYSGDFKWESHRLDRVVTLSARTEDSAGLEEFMMREFFGPPGPTARRR